MKLRSILLILLVSSTIQAATLRHHAADPRSACTLSIAPRVLSFPAAGGSATVVVNAAGPCLWSSHASDGWIATSDTTHGVTVTVTPSTSALPRGASIDIGGFPVTVTQDAFSLPNLVTNGSFDQNVSGWSTSFSEGTGSAVWSPNDANGSAASGSAKITLTGSNRNVGYQLTGCVNVKPSTRYEWGAKLLIPAGQDPSGVAFINLYELPLADCVANPYTSSSFNPFKTAPSWTSFSQTTVTQSSTQSVFFIVGIGAVVSPPYTAYFDDAYMREK